MTYCIGILVRTGLIMIADTRTNAGVDNISVYRKLHTLADSDDRLIFAASAGNLSVTQSVLSLLREGLPPLGEDPSPRLIDHQPSMFRVAQLVGEAVTITGGELRPGLRAAGVSAGISLLLGGRIGDGPLKLFLIYDAGNFIECQPDSPFFQIGATQYGKPILDRAMDYETTLDEAVKVGLLSFDSTIRSDLAVGLPLDVLVVNADPARPAVRQRIEPDDPYFRALSASWARSLLEARDAIEDPPFLVTK